MTKNDKEENKKILTGYRKKINCSLYILMEERNENYKRNGEWQKWKELPKSQQLELKEKMDVKMLVEAEDRRNEFGRY